MISDGIVWVLRRVLRLEHIIYCATGCRVELLLHKKYYAYRVAHYNEYLRQQYPEWYNDNVL